MAKGVFSAHSVARPQNNPVLRQIHDLVDNLAAMWPAAQAGEGHLTPRQQGANENKSSSIHLKPVAPCKPGERVAISMTLRNSESRPVHLVPAGTDLLGSRGGQIACSLLEFAPAEITLEPQQQEDLAVSITIPASAARGCYAGLLVLRGLENLHAIITIEVD